MTNTTEISAAQMREWIGRTIADPDGHKIGKVKDVYVDEATHQAEWFAVSTGWFGNHVSFVPIAGTAARGDELQAQWTKDQVKSAPHAEPDGELTQQDEADLYRHYGLRFSRDRSGSGLPDGAQGSQRTQRTQRNRTAQAQRGPRREQDGDQGAVIRSEEELRVGKHAEETGRARLRKWVETEHVTMKVPVSREEARIRREPIKPGEDVGQADLGDSEREMILHEEQIDARVEAVPKERVRLEKETVTEEKPVEADVRKERVEVDGVDDGRGRRRNR